MKNWTTNDVLIAEALNSCIEADSVWSGPILEHVAEPDEADGVEMLISMSGETKKVWIRETELCEWLQPVISVQRLEDMPPEFHTLCGELILSEIAHWMNSCQLGKGRFLSFNYAKCSARPRVDIVLVRTEMELRLGLQNWTSSEIGAIASVLRSRRRRNNIEIAQLNIPIVIGRTQLTLSQARNLERGDAVSLCETSLLSAGEAWIFGERPVARIRVENGALCILEKYEYEGSYGMQPDNAVWVPPIWREELNNRPVDDEIYLTVVAEIARVKLSLEQLRSLDSGSLLEQGLVTNGGVSLTINGQTIAQGTLICADGRYLVRVS